LSAGAEGLYPAVPDESGAPSQKEDEMASDDKPKPDFSNVQSGGSSTAPSPPSAAPSAPPAAEKTYTVVSGDNLSKIAKRLYGDAKKWRKIYEANTNVIKDPDKIFPGQELKIPPL
jgi:nucleoid-associated protein YgaU